MLVYIKNIFLHLEMQICFQKKTTYSEVLQTSSTKSPPFSAMAFSLDQSLLLQIND